MTSPLVKLGVDAQIFKLQSAGHNFIFAFFYFPGLRAMVLLRLAQWLHHKKLSALAYLLVVLNDFLHGIWVGPKAQIGEGLFLGHPRGLVVNPNARIGRFCSFAQQVDVGGPRSSLGDFVNMGAGAKVVSTKARPVRVGSFVVIGAGAVVTRDIPDRVVVAGVPARVVRTLTDDDIKQRWRKQFQCAAGQGIDIDGPNESDQI